MLEITSEQLQPCAEKWGWEYFTELVTILPPRFHRLYFWRNKCDLYNAQAILAVEARLLANGYDFEIDGGYSAAWVVPPNYTEGDVRAHVDFLREQHIKPNFRSWLLVQITLQLPEEAFKEPEVGE